MGVAPLLLFDGKLSRSSVRESSSLAGVLGPVDTVGVLGVAAEPILRTPADMAARREPDAETGVGNDGVLKQTRCVVS